MVDKHGRQSGWKTISVLLALSPLILGLVFIAVSEWDKVRTCPDIMVICPASELNDELANALLIATPLLLGGSALAARKARNSRDR